MKLRKAESKMKWGRRLIAGFLLMVPIQLSAQTYGLTPDPRQTFVNSSGVPFASGKLCSFAAGTTTPRVTFSNNTGTANANPLTLDAAGRAVIYLDTSLSYKFSIYQSGGDSLCPNSGTLVYTQDNISVTTPANFTITTNVIPRGNGVANGLVDGCLSDTGAALSTSCTLGVTSTATLGTASVTNNLTVSGAATVTGALTVGSCSGCSSTRTRAMPNVAQSVIISSGTPVTTVLGTGVTAVVMGGTSASAVTTWVQVPPDAQVANPLTLNLTYSVLVAPGVTNNRVRLQISCTVNATATAITAGDTITLANNTTPASYTGTVNTCASSTYAVGDIVIITITRDITVANNYPNDFNIRTFGVNYVSAN